MILAIYLYQSLLVPLQRHKHAPSHVETLTKENLASGEWLYWFFIQHPHAQELAGTLPASGVEPPIRWYFWWYLADLRLTNHYQTRRSGRNSVDAAPPNTRQRSSARCQEKPATASRFAGFLLPFGWSERPQSHVRSEISPRGDFRVVPLPCRMCLELFQCGKALCPIAARVETQLP